TTPKAAATRQIPIAPPPTTAPKRVLKVSSSSNTFGYELLLSLGMLQTQTQAT
ncbi:unnamed protein product, partial [Didymodactylos carnosus]